MTAKDRYTKHRIAGLDHRAAANKAGIKNRNTRYAYGREYTETLAREAVARAGEAAKAKKDAQDAARAREAAAKAQEVARIKHEAWLASPEGKAEAEATKAADKRCPVCGYPVGKCPTPVRTSRLSSPPTLPNRPQPWQSRPSSSPRILG